MYNVIKLKNFMLFVRGEDGVDHDAVSRSIKKFYSGYRNLDD